MADEGPDTSVKCPFCSEAIQSSAKKCRHCGEFIDAAMREIQLLKSQKQNVFMNAGGGGGGGSSASSAASGVGRSLARMTCLDWILTLCTCGLWLIVVALRGLL